MVWFMVQFKKDIWGDPFQEVLPSPKNIPRALKHNTQNSHSRNDDEQTIAPTFQRALVEEMRIYVLSEADLPQL
jgi:hypothetical protein